MSRIADRHLEILRYLGRGRIMSVREIAEKTVASVSTIKRDLIDLSCRYPIQSLEGRNGGYKMDKCCVIGNQFLTRAEIEYIRKTVESMPNDEIKTILLQKLSPSMH